MSVVKLEMILDITNVNYNDYKNQTQHNIIVCMPLFEEAYMTGNKFFDIQVRIPVSNYNLSKKSKSKYYYTTYF